MKSSHQSVNGETVSNQQNKIRRANSINQKIDSNYDQNIKSNLARRRISTENLSAPNKYLLAKDLIETNSYEHLDERAPTPPPQQLKRSPLPIPSDHPNTIAQSHPTPAHQSNSAKSSKFQNEESDYVNVQTPNEYSPYTPPPHPQNQKRYSRTFSNQYHTPTRSFLADEDDFPVEETMKNALSRISELERVVKRLYEQGEKQTVELQIKDEQIQMLHEHANGVASQLNNLQKKETESRQKILDLEQALSDTMQDCSDLKKWQEHNHGLSNQLAQQIRNVQEDQAQASYDHQNLTTQIKQFQLQTASNFQTLKTSQDLLSELLTTQSSHPDISSYNSPRSSRFMEPLTPRQTRFMEYRDGSDSQYFQTSRRESTNSSSTPMRLQDSLNALRISEVQESNTSFENFAVNSVSGQGGQYGQGGGLVGEEEKYEEQVESKPAVVDREAVLKKIDELIKQQADINRKHQRAKKASEKQKLEGDLDKVESELGRWRLMLKKKI
ncbi:hypothetical protein HK098_006651 [Nowakowskiella sp. JEL0407]|nr:hypothetical protein HK098_006651 [Nowakowskiella sp. JEL0407]